MSKIKNGGLDQYGKWYKLNRIGGERANYRQFVGLWIIFKCFLLVVVSRIVSKDSTRPPGKTSLPK